MPVTQLPAGDFQVSLFAQTPPDGDPSNLGGCSNFCIKNIPTPQAATGQNYTRINDAELDRLVIAVDNELVESTRLDQYKKESDRSAELVPALPLDPLFEPAYYYSNRLGGNFTDNPVYGVYVNAATWYCKTASC